MFKISRESRKQVFYLKVQDLFISHGMCSFHSLMFSCLFLLLHLGLWLFHLLLHHQRPILEVLRRMFARKNSQPFTPIALAAPTETTCGRRNQSDPYFCHHHEFLHYGQLWWQVFLQFITMRALISCDNRSQAQACLQIMCQLTHEANYAITVV